MYRLAEKVRGSPVVSGVAECTAQLGLEELEKLSFQAIRAGLSQANILEEVFSRFTSQSV
jgi:hypothetical protein